MNFVSATINKKVERLGEKLMANFEKVGFDLDVNDGNDDSGRGEKITIPKQIH